MSEPENIGAAALGWWSRALNDRGGGRMARAQLRRCSSPPEALAHPATHDLHAALDGRLRHRADTLALIAISLANLRETAPQSAAQRMGASLSALRFQRLIRCTDAADLIRPLRRALHQIDGRANVARLAEDLFWWSDRTRNSWCFDYYGEGFADPVRPDNPEPETTA